VERRSFLKNAGAGVAGAAVLAAPYVQAQTPAIRWRLASSFPKTTDIIFGAAETFAKLVSAGTGGKFQITVHAANEIIPPFEVVNGVQGGSIEAAHTAPYYFFGKDETFAFDCAVPFGLNSRQMSAWMYGGNGLKLLRDFYKNFNIVNFPMGNTGAQMGGWYRKPISSLADMKGMKIRVGGFGGRVLERIGAVPQNIPGGDVYSALEKGSIDATEWVGPYDDEKLGFNKIAPNYYYPGWWEGGAQLSLYINNKAWDSLPADYKAVVEAAAGFAHVEMQAKYDARNPAALKKLVGSGTKLHRFPKDVLEAAFKASHDVYGELSSKNPNWKKVYEDWVKFRNDQVLWFRFAEAGFDDFMQSQKF